MWNTLLMKFHLSFVWLCHLVCHDLLPTRQENRIIRFVLCYSRITSINNPSFCIPAVSASHKVYDQPTSCHMTAAAMSADRYWHLDRPDYWITCTQISRTLPAFNTILVSRTLPSPQAGNFVELILLYTQNKTTHLVDSAGDVALAVPELT